MTEELEALARFKAAVAKLVSDNFTRTGRGLLLARLGTALRYENVSVDAVLNGRKLASVLRESLTDVVTVVSSPAHPQLIGAFPVGKAPTDVSADSFDTSQILTRPALNVRRYDPRFWAAFTKPIAEGKKRVVSLDPIGFTDIDEASEADSGGFDLAASYICARNGITKADYEQAVIESLEQWLTENNVEFHQVEQGASSRKQEIKDRNILEQMLRLLSEEQQRRISLPLDVIAKLIKS